MKLEVGKKYKRGNTVVEVKFFDKTGHAWGLSTEGCAQCISSSKHEWQEVTDTPDPGEGWRLISPGERLEAGDQWWCNGEEAWIDTLQDGQLQGGDYVYRRRIAPQYVPYTWEDREELRGRWYRKKGDNREFMVSYITRHNEKNISIGPWRVDAFLKDCEWHDGTPCGKKVE